MKRYFICLANSKKLSNRCIAGIEVKKNNGSEVSYSVIKKDDKPKWVRPVTAEEHGEVPSNLVEGISLLDVVEIDIIEEVPNGYQSENVRFEASSLKVINKIGLSSSNLDLLLDSQQENLFGNKGKAIHTDIIESLSNSLTLIKVNKPCVYFKEEKDQYRLKFLFNEASFDLPITDVKFIEYCRKIDDSVLEEQLQDEVYLAISVGVKFGDFYYKLVAGVIHKV